MFSVLSLEEKVYELSISPDIPNIFKAAADDDVEALEIALPHYGVNAKDENDMTPLHYAAGNLSFNTAERLLEEPDVDRECRDKFGRDVAMMGYEVAGFGHKKAREMYELIHPAPQEDLDLDDFDDDQENNQNNPGF